MSQKFLAQLQRELDGLREKQQYRRIPELPPGAVNFSSNDYLGFAHNVELKRRVRARAQDVPLSSGSSRLLPGNHEILANAENAFASFVGADSALLFNSGFDANAALLTTLATRHDLILYDERSHASSIDGVRASQAASYRFRHNDIEHLCELIATHAASARQIFIVVESVYSMDGDLSPLRELNEIAREHQAILIVDEAHATGIIGERGEGLVTALGIRDPHVISMHTCGKALGASGGIVAADATVRDYLINRARPLIFTTALPPLVAVQIEESVKYLVEHGDQLITELSQDSLEVRNALRLQLQHWKVPDGITPIVPIIIGSNEQVLAASALLREQNYWVSAIRPPSVPAGTSRLRLNISSLHTAQERANVVNMIVAAERELVESVELAQVA